MKRSYAANLRGSSALSNAAATVIDIDDDAAERLARAEILLREANDARIKHRLDQLDEQAARALEMESIRLKAAMAHARKCNAVHSIHQVFEVEGKDGSKRFETVIHQQASKEIIDLMENPRPLLTGAMWNELDVPARYKFLKQNGLPLDKVVGGVLDVLPETSKEFLLRWQKLINNGAVWHNSMSVGTRAEHLIKTGFLLYGKEAVTFEESPMVVEARSKNPGQPGSAGFVKAIMGKEFLAWLTANEEHPIDA